MVTEKTNDYQLTESSFAEDKELKMLRRRNIKKNLEKNAQTRIKHNLDSLDILILGSSCLTF